MSGRNALVVGAGGVLGAALCREFTRAGYRVMGLRRSAGCGAAEGARLIACDLADPLATGAAIGGLVDELGHIDVAVCNAAHLVAAPFDELPMTDFDTSWRVAFGSAMACARAVLPSMRSRAAGALLFTGATGSMRGTARFTAFAAAKFAVRGFAQALAREVQASGVHVAHFVLDGILRGSASEKRFGKTPEQCLDPEECASIYRQIAEQRPTAWTHEIDLRPRTERF